MLDLKASHMLKANIKAFVDNATLTLFSSQINLISSLNNYVSSLKGNVITIKMKTQLFS